MEITRSIEQDGTLGPLALNYLGGIPQHCLFHELHQLRHPLAIYNLSLASLANAFSQVTSAYLAKTAEYSRGIGRGLDILALLEHHKNLLRCLQEHIDECYLILKTLVDPAAFTKRNRFADKFVLGNGLPGAKSFEGAIAAYKSSLRIANKLKHQQGRLRGVAIFPGESVHLGYWLEEPDKGGVLGPAVDIHPDMAAISFARDLRWHLFNVYACSEQLVKAVETAVETLHGVKLVPIKAANEESGAKLTSAISMIPLAIFPREQEKGIAMFYVDDKDQCLRIEYPYHIRTLWFPAMKVEISTVGDGVSKKFRFPVL